MTQILVGPRSQDIFKRSAERIPGGVNSPVRAWARLGGIPAVIRSGDGAWLTDVDGMRYLDFVLSWGPLLHGHAHPEVVQAIQIAAADGTSFGAPIQAELELAEVLCQALPSMDMVRLVNSGTEATMSALRLARAATGRDLIIKCDGGYHGHSDQLLVAAGSGVATFGHSDSAGVSDAFAQQTLVVPYNDAQAMTDVFAAHGDNIAALIIEPVAGNMGMVPPAPGFLEHLRTVTEQHGALLIFDEVMTGFRVAWGGYQNICGVTPDLTCLGKVIGGGMPLAAYGGRADIMKQLAPQGPCYQAGTLSGNPIAVAAGLANLRLTGGQACYDDLEIRLRRMVDGIACEAKKAGLPFQSTVIGSMWGYFISETPVTDFPSAAAADMERWRIFCSEMIRGGVYLACSPFEAAFFSTAHTDEDIDFAINAAATACAAATA